MRTVKIKTPQDSESKNFALRGDDTVRDMLQDLGYTERGVTVYLNSSPVSGSDLDTALEDGDRIETALVKSKSGNRG